MGGNAPIYKGDLGVTSHSSDDVSLDYIYVTLWTGRGYGEKSGC